MRETMETFRKGRRGMNFCIILTVLIFVTSSLGCGLREKNDPNPKIKGQEQTADAEVDRADNGENSDKKLCKTFIKKWGNGITFPFVKCEFEENTVTCAESFEGPRGRLEIKQVFDNHQDMKRQFLLEQFTVKTIEVTRERRGPYPGNYCEPTAEEIESDVSYGCLNLYRFNDSFKYVFQYNSEDKLESIDLASEGTWHQGYRMRFGDDRPDRVKSSQTDIVSAGTYTVQSYHDNGNPNILSLDLQRTTTEAITNTENPDRDGSVVVEEESENEYKEAAQFGFGFPQLDEVSRMMPPTLPLSEYKQNNTVVLETVDLCQESTYL